MLHWSCSNDTLLDVSILPIWTKTRTCSFLPFSCYRLEKSSHHPDLEVSRTLHALMFRHDSVQIDTMKYIKNWTRYDKGIKVTFFIFVTKHDRPAGLGSPVEVKGLWSSATSGAWLLRTQTPNQSDIAQQQNWSCASPASIAQFSFYRIKIQHLQVCNTHAYYVIIANKLR